MLHHRVCVEGPKLDREKRRKCGLLTEKGGEWTSELLRGLGYEGKRAPEGAGCWCWRHVACRSYWTRIGKVLALRNSVSLSNCFMRGEKGLIVGTYGIGILFGKGS